MWRLNVSQVRFYLGDLGLVVQRRISANSELGIT